ncbi:hypothetical protein HYPSUDRAFT_62502 [Hypholoma sublateritium FD-334 SS-4]|uniref:Uncharacterized protein n=1 Tax=Hypholoma sublateritium (strain FD-334 SS-4) TaxID=945553 RepID=A0A0D2Q8U5_HYPSF|nr:hypothetical protein HYPSUDRAFT_62502 [Hypholoma sublateritium FD-334 SS-4]
MFATHSPYSPFFTSGLLSAGSRPHSPDVPLSPRRGSLPTSRADDVPAFYFTLHNEDAFRSFLSLDLAESQSMRSASLKRKASTVSKPYRFPRISEAPPPLRMRFSRDSLRTIPSPKPAPSITLPALPKVASSPPRLPSIQLSPSLDISLVTRTVPPPLRLDTTTRRNSVVTTSTVSTRARTSNRSAALARLEGRDRRPNTAPLPKRNFMSMSDDDDSDSDAAADADDDLSDLDAADFTFPALRRPDPRAEPEDVVLPPRAPHTFLEAPRSAPLPPRPRAKRASTAQEDAPLRRQRTRTRAPAGAGSEWFPLRSFIDLHAEPAVDPAAAARAAGLRRVYGAPPVGKTASGAGWAWRSFIEVANVS